MDKNIQISSFFESGVFQDFYQILEVSKNASDEEIKKSYRRLSKIYHPDMPTANVEKMKRVGIAYGILKKPELRQLYDEYYSKYKNGNSTDYNGSNYGFGTTNTRAYSNHTRNNSNAYTKSNNYSNASTSCSFTENEIREILRKNHYSEFKIEDFLYWCRKENIKIYSMTGLSTYFSRYMWSKSEQKEEKKTSREFNNNSTTYHSEPVTPKRQETPRKIISESSSMNYELRQMLVRRMILEEMMRYYAYQNMMNYYRTISNIQFYTPVYSKVRLYRMPSNIYFYSVPSRGYVYKLYR